MTSSKDFLLTETIIAPATPPGQGALAVVRLSGPEAFPIALRIFRPKRRKSLPPWRLVSGRLVDFEKNEDFDEATAVFFPAPRSYTREDMVEIICHGSPVILEETIRLGIKAGARMAHPGEFTLRAYLNGRIDLLQAEAVNDLVRATSLRQARLSFRQLDGRLSRRLDNLRQQLIQLLSEVEVAIEFPEEGLEISRHDLARRLRAVEDEVKKLIRSYDLGKALTRGITLAIVGRANVGKSTLFNAMLEKDRAIVSPYPGTTRDYLEEKIRIKDLAFTLIDMAGLDVPSHPVEEEGIRRARGLAAQADGLLIMLDVSQSLTPGDEELMAMAREKKAVFVLNKIDLSPCLEKDKIEAFSPGRPVIEVSALHGVNLDYLKEVIYEVFAPEAGGNQEEVIFHWREKASLEEVSLALEKGLMALEAGYSEELVAEEIRQAVPVVGQLTGEIRSDDIINAIFSEFCIGK